MANLSISDNLKILMREYVSLPFVDTRDIVSKTTHGNVQLVLANTSILDKLLIQTIIKSVQYGLLSNGGMLKCNYNDLLKWLDVNLLKENNITLKSTDDQPCNMYITVITTIDTVFQIAKQTYHDNYIFIFNPVNQSNINAELQDISRKTTLQELSAICKCEVQHAWIRLERMRDPKTTPITPIRTRLRRSTSKIIL